VFLKNKQFVVVYETVQIGLSEDLSGPIFIGGAGNFHLGSYSPRGLGDGSPPMGSKGEAVVGSPQKLKQFVDAVYRF